MSQRLKKTIILSDENYYSQEADLAYMSVSQYKKFLECETAALAKLKGEWTPESDPKALLVGNYVHSYFESPKFMKHLKKKIKQDVFFKKTVWPTERFSNCGADD